MQHRLIHGDCLNVLRDSNDAATCIFADPPDNLGLSYDQYDDSRSESDYCNFLHSCIELFIHKARIVWISHNVKWNFHIGSIVKDILSKHCWLEAKSCVQVFTFGQHNQNDLGNCHRPLLRLKRKKVHLYPNQIRVPSQRQLNGDNRADPRGRVPGDVFDFPRVTGNSRQRRKWCPTQLHEGLIKRCIKLSTLKGDTVIDPFAGTGTTLRVCKGIGRNCTLIEQSLGYCEKISAEHGVSIERIKPR